VYVAEAWAIEQSGLGSGTGKVAKSRNSRARIVMEIYWKNKYGDSKQKVWM
jgi:hypothetical protein